MKKFTLKVNVTCVQLPQNQKISFVLHVEINMSGYFKLKLKT